MQTDYQRLTNEIRALGGRLIDRLGSREGRRDGKRYRFEGELWKLAGRGLAIFRCPEGDLVSLYAFVGEEADTVDQDIAFVRSLVNQSAVNKEAI